LPDREDKLFNVFPGSSSIKVGRKTVSPAGSDMTASAGKLVHELFSVSFLRRITKSKSDKSPRTQPGMGDVLTF